MIKDFKFIFFILIILSIPSIIGFLHSGFPLTDDGNWMVIRFSAFFETLRSGQFPVRFLMRLNYGFGYPVADFLYPLFMYIAVPLHVIGFSFVESIKALIVLSIVTSGIFSYLWLRRLFDELSSLAGSVFYIYFPYHLFDVYKRGSVGELLSISILPFVLWQIERKSIVLASIGVAFIILAHNTLAVLFLGLIFLYAAINILMTGNRKQALYYYLLIFGIGIGISTFFWLPAIYDLKYTVFASLKISEYKNYFADLNLIGLSPLVVILLTFVFIGLGKLKIKKHKLTMLMLVVCIFSILISLKVSAFVWNILPVSFIQFPFRFLSLTIVSASFLTACLISLFNGWKKIVGFIIVIVVSGVFAYPYLTIKNYQNYPDTFYSTNQDTTTVKNEYMPAWVKEAPSTSSLVKVVNLTTKENINTTLSNANKTEFVVSLEKPSVVQINTIYFPGWNALVNGKKTNISYDNKGGLMHLNLFPGQNSVKVFFAETNIRLISDLISVLSLLSLLGIYLIKRTKIYN